MAKFDAKSFNEKAFGKYMSAIPNVKLNKLKESRAIVSDQRLKETFVTKLWLNVLNKKYKNVYGTIH